MLETFGSKSWLDHLGLARLSQAWLNVNWLGFALNGLIRFYVPLLVFDWLGRHLQPRLDIDWL